MKPLSEGMQGMIDYVSPLVDKRLANPGDDFISVLAQGEKAGVFTRHQVLVNTSLLLLAAMRRLLTCSAMARWHSSAILSSGNG